MMALPKTLNEYTYEQLSKYIYEEINGILYFSVKSIIIYDRNRIGMTPPFNIAKVEFESTADIQAWECRATLEGQPYGIGIGLLISSGTANIPAGAKTYFNITDTQLIYGDGKYRISLYVKKDNIWYGGE